MSAQRDRARWSARPAALLSNRHRHRHRVLHAVKALALLALVAMTPTVAGVADTDTRIGAVDDLVSVKASQRGDSGDGGDVVVGNVIEGDIPNNITPNPSFAVYRVLGNDMWPLQGVGQIRLNSVFSAIHEVKPPSDVPVFWIVNRIVNATERSLLIDGLKNAGVEESKILHVYPPLAAASCFTKQKTDRKDQTDSKGSPDTNTDTKEQNELVLFAQAQNSVRNAAVKHAFDSGYDWAVPLDGNQFLPADFYEVTGNALKAADEKNKVAMLIPMLRLRAEQSGAVYNGHTTFEKIANLHLRDEGKFSISEPQLAVHSKNAKARNFSFNENAAYGAGNKAGLLRALCPVSRGNWKTDDNTPHQHAHCCELVTMKLRQQGCPPYYGGELDLKKYARSGRRKQNETDFSETKDAWLQKATLDAAQSIFAMCGATVRLFNYPPDDLGLTQTKIATSVLTRAKTRGTAGRVFEAYLGSYFANLDASQVWSGETCLEFDPTEVSLSSVDREVRLAETQARAMTETMSKVKQAVIDKSVGGSKSGGKKKAPSKNEKETPRLPESKRASQVVVEETRADGEAGVRNAAVAPASDPSKKRVLGATPVFVKESVPLHNALSRNNARTSHTSFEKISTFKPQKSAVGFPSGRYAVVFALVCFAVAIVSRRRRRRRMHG